MIAGSHNRPVNLWTCYPILTKIISKWYCFTSYQLVQSITIYIIKNWVNMLVFSFLLCGCVRFGFVVFIIGKWPFGLNMVYHYKYFHVVFCMWDNNDSCRCQHMNTWQGLDTHIEHVAPLNVTIVLVHKFIMMMQSSLIWQMNYNCFISCVWAL